MKGVSHPNVDIIREGNAAFRRGDRISLRQHLLTPDVRWQIVQIYHMQDGRVTEVWSTPWDQRAGDEFWS